MRILKINKWKLSAVVLFLLFLVLGGMYIYRYEPFRESFEISDDLGGNIFPSALLSTATTDAQIIVTVFIWGIRNRASPFGSDLVMLIVK